MPMTHSERSDSSPAAGEHSGWRASCLRRLARALAAGVLSATAAFATAAPARAVEALRAHEITYHTAFKGIGAGDLQLTLRPDGAPDRWRYETRPFPSVLARFVVSADSRERSVFLLKPEGVEPQHYLIDGGADPSKRTELKYDWARGRVTGTSRGAALDLAIKPGTQDTMSIRIAVVADLLAGREPSEYAMLDGDEVKHYVYHRAGTAHLKTALGELDTVIFTSERKGSDGRDRTWQYWYAPSLGWLPVRIEQRQDGAARLTFLVHSFKWLPPSGPTTPAEPGDSGATPPH
jgi:hypothetical protein